MDKVFTEAAPKQISAAFGSSLFIGLMGAVQAKHFAVLVHPDFGQRQAAVISGTDAAFTAALVLVLIGLALSPFVRSKRREAAPI